MIIHNGLTIKEFKISRKLIWYYLYFVSYIRYIHIYIYTLFYHGSVWVYHVSFHFIQVMQSSICSGLILWHWDKGQFIHSRVYGPLCMCYQDVGNSRRYTLRLLLFCVEFEGYFTYVSVCGAVNYCQTYMQWYIIAVVLECIAIKEISI